MLKGENDHHKVDFENCFFEKKIDFWLQSEAAFKAVALALRVAFSVDSALPSSVPSTKVCFFFFF